MSDTKIVRSHGDGFTRQFLARQRLLVVAPHADDETWSATATIRRGSTPDAGRSLVALPELDGDQTSTVVKRNGAKRITDSQRAYQPVWSAITPLPSP